ncbi:hypothetical protein [Streptomyces sp. NBC_00083]|uniref:hypothetical protein n=1 Tax=Streptomyces sp. NBC_00083 TaxID=2975647 RepID=UPI00224EACF2|nr:hypothetical protein [Streptomyces sp. NBC_00083]MCX5384502.1 hypothetical protein [Streptomyces sp. NBC_00083]
MKPRLLPDTHLLPSERGVVISGPGRTTALARPGIYPWLERLRPFLDGRSTLDQLTADLPPQAAHQVRTLVELLAREGFVRDATTDRPHGLSPQVCEHHTALIDFIAARTDSPEHRFERYRHCAPLVVGSGHMASALVLALLASGVAHVRLRLSEPRGNSGGATDMTRLNAWVALCREEGGSFHFGQLDDDPAQLPPDVGVVLHATDTHDPGAALLARALAHRGGLRYGQAAGQGERIVISAVTLPEAVSDMAGSDGPPRAEPGRPTVGARDADGIRLREPSPYLGGPIAALAANQLCMHLLHEVAQLHTDAGGPEPSATPPAAVLDLVTGRFLGTEPS